MPIRTLPDGPDLEHLRGEAKTLLRDVRSGDPQARDLVAEFDPRSADPAGFTLATAQLVVARSYGFGSWPRLHRHVDIVTEFTRRPEPVDLDGPGTPDRFLQLACLTYTRDDTAHAQRARALLAADPDLATASVHTMAAAGAVEPLQRALAQDPARANALGGPWRWQPLLYLTYSRLGDTGPGRSAVQAARVLLAAGADPNAGSLWFGLTSAFTALTGAFGGGEQDQPPHPQAQELARLLLAAGADPNDNQALYNRMFRPRNDHLELLFEFGLGTDRESPWRQRLGHTYPTPTEMVQEQLRWAAAHDFGERVELLLARGVDPDGLGYHPVFGEQTAYELAMRAGNARIADLLAAAGARTDRVDALGAFLAACLAGDRARVEQARAQDPALLDRARNDRPDAVAAAAEVGHIEGVRLLLDLGFDVDGGGTTALHQATYRSDLATARLLVDRGADLQRRDPRFDSTPLGWAEHLGRDEMAAYLREHGAET